MLCGGGLESAVHLFLHCLVADKVWGKVLEWLDFNFLTPPNLFVHFLCWSREPRSRTLRRGFWLIWHATIWILWKERNNRIFSNVSKEVVEIVDEIKTLSWQWSLVRLRNGLCLFYEWTWNPWDCMNRA